jgi:hypothetical protein
MTVINGSYQQESSFNGEDRYNYEYPFGLNLVPGSKLHSRIVEEVMNRAKESRRHMEQRFSGWDEIDKVLSVYIYQDEEDRKTKKKDPRKPTTIVVPTMLASLDTILTYMATSLWTVPFFKYEGVSPGDIIGAILLEKVIELQGNRSKFGLNLHTMWRDAFVYGFGVVWPEWYRRTGFKTEIRPKLVHMPFTGQSIEVGQERVSVRTTVFEGNRINNIDPRRYLPDINQPINEPQNGEYVGWISSTNYSNLLTAESDPENVIFNVKYLKSVNGKSALSVGDDRFDRNGITRETLISSTTKPIDTVSMVINLIPREWKLGKEEYPEKWLFTIGSDNVVLQAMPLALNHDMFPVAVIAPDFDGHSLHPLSRMETIFGLQEVTNYLFNSRIHNIRKVLNDVLIYDPSIINSIELENAGAGGFVKLRRSAWGKQAKDAVWQLPIQDVTRSNIGDMTFTSQMMDQVTGAQDSLRGTRRNSSDRVTAEEISTEKWAALSRLGKAARIMAMQGHWDLAYMLASQTQQLMTKEVYVKATGEWEQQLRSEYGDIPRIMAGPDSLLIDYDIVPFDGVVSPGHENVQSWLQLMQTAQQNPSLAPAVDWRRVFTTLARRLGEPNVNNFLVQQMPPEQVIAQQQAGNIIPVGGIE